jgi:hypothetical protein
MLINWAPSAIGFREKYGLRAYLAKRQENRPVPGNKGGI